ncbi:hypothetical protein MTR62_09870 [Novosphingobium sp. 1949]|uniref:Uncharacterized protein n=1 Tax=Novosphingobium organovorum TaxID=2930092 RepID=A0ABT0BD70_9SPHN|nr:hypothetical protein [Novosphingobium organovorum]MCJ2182998.1 hypothetical protein [Novosphingobium organovorum]
MSFTGVIATVASVYSQFQARVPAEPVQVVQTQVQDGDGARLPLVRLMTGLSVAVPISLLMWAGIFALIF